MIGLLGSVKGSVNFFYICSCFWHSDTSVWQTDRQKSYAKQPMLPGSYSF